MLINDYGEVWRLSKRAWRRYCGDWITKRGDVRLSDYGTNIGHIHANITDWHEEEFQRELGVELDL